MHGKIFKSFDAYLQEGSGWVFDEVVKIDLKLANYVPVQGNSYIPAPPRLRSKHCLINVRNDDDKCFAWAVLSALKNLETNPIRVAKHKQFEHELIMGGILYAVQTGHLPKFEKQNGISINLYGYDDGEIFPLCISKLEHAVEIEMLLLKDETKSHYVWIKNLSRFLRHLTKHDWVAHYCRYCLHPFCRADLLSEHTILCKNHIAQRIKMPDAKNDILLIPT